MVQGPRKALVEGLRFEPARRADHEVERLLALALALAWADHRLYEKAEDDRIVRHVLLQRIRVWAVQRPKLRPHATRLSDRLAQFRKTLLGGSGVIKSGG